MNFIAIDFETANSDRHSPCEIGLVLVENFEIKEKLSFLIRPKENYFDAFNVDLHGIDENLVENESEFDVVYNKLKTYFSNYPIVAHNASFDISVLRHTLDLYNIDYPETKYSCTYQMSKQHLKGQFSYKLDSICNYYNLELDHHRALSDAIACAEIAIKIFKERNIIKFDQISESFNLNIGKLFKGGYSGSRTKHIGYKVNELEFNKENFKPNNPFYNQTVIFTGTLTMVRKEAQIMVLEVGGKCGNGVTTDTNYLVVGAQDYQKYGEGFRSRKMKKAEKYLANKQQIELLTEEQFLEMINEE